MRRLLVVLLLVGAVAFVVRGGLPCETVQAQPGCYVALKPGPTQDAASLVEIDGVPSYAPSGELRLTTVAVEEELDLASWARAVLSPGTDTAPRTALFPPGADREEVARQNAALMAESQLEATVAALRHAGYEIDEELDGARVEELLSATAREVLEVGDVIVAVDGEPTTDSAAVAAAIGAVDPGERVVLDVEREGEELRLEATVGAAPDDADRAFLGVLLTSHLELPFDVVIDAGIIGGPSAGLMFALSIIELLAPDDLTGGTVVAGTGTVDRDGTVGPVGGLPQKIAGAADASDDGRAASVFLVPAEGLEPARDVPVANPLLLVPVTSLDEALDALAEIREGGRPAGAVLLPGTGD